MDHMTVTPAVETASSASDPGADRPPFWIWYRLSGQSLRGIADKLGVSTNLVFLWMLPWADQRRSPPTSPAKARIETLTEGVVRADRDWTPPAVEVDQ